MPAEPPANPTIGRCRGGFFVVRQSPRRFTQEKRSPALMPSIFAFAKRIANRSAWLALLPALVVCSGDKSTGNTAQPGAVSDLIVAAAADTSVTLSFTQVDD